MRDPADQNEGASAASESEPAPSVARRRRGARGPCPRGGLRRCARGPCPRGGLRRCARPRRPERRRFSCERKRARAERSEVASGVLGGRAPGEDYGGVRDPADQNEGASAASESEPAPSAARRRRGARGPCPRGGLRRCARPRRPERRRFSCERKRARAERSEVASGVLGGRAPGEDYGGGGWAGC